MAVVGIAASAASAQTRLAVTVGFDGAFRPGAPTAVDVEIPPLPAGGPAQLILETSALTPQAGRATVSTTVGFQAVAGAAQTLSVPVVIEDLRRPLRVRLLVGGRPAAAADVALDPTRAVGRLVVLVSAVRTGLSVLRRADPPVVDAYVAADALPSEWQEYRGVDLLVLRDIDPARLSDRQRGALLTWVRLGGRLVVIARPGVALPAFLTPIMPAYAGPPQVLRSASDLAARYSASVPAGPVPIVALVPQPAALVVRAGGMPVVAAAAEGNGRVSVWGLDPTIPPLADWDGGTRLWAETLGAPAPALADPAALAGVLDLQVPADRFSHVAAGFLMAVYVGGLAIVRRRRPTLMGGAAVAVAAVVAVAVFATLAAGARARSTALSQVVVVQQAPETQVASALIVAATAVPYGGVIALRAPDGAAASPVAVIGDLSIRRDGGPTLLTGRMRADVPWVFEAATAVPLSASADFAASGSLTADLPAAGLRDAAVWWHGLVYPLGDLPGGRSESRVPGAGWRPAGDVVTDQRSPGRFFRAPGSQIPGAITQAPQPLLIGAWPVALPAFALADPSGGRAAGAEDVVLVLPVRGRPPVQRSVP